MVIKMKQPETIQELIYSDLQKMIGVNWHRLRTEHGLSVYELSERSGISYTTICDIENCRSVCTAIEVCARAAKLYGMSLETFIGELTKGISREDPVPYKDITRTSLHDVYPYNMLRLVFGEVPDISDINLKGVKEVLSTLSLDEQTVLDLKYRYGKQAVEIAKAMKLTIEDVHCIEEKALSRLRYPARMNMMRSFSYSDMKKALDAACK